MLTLVLILIPTIIVLVNITLCEHFIRQRNQLSPILNGYIIPKKDNGIFYVENDDDLFRISNTFNGMAVYVRKSKKLYLLKCDKFANLNTWIEIGKTL